MLSCHYCVSWRWCCAASCKQQPAASKCCAAVCCACLFCLPASSACPQCHAPALWLPTIMTLQQTQQRAAAQRADTFKVQHQLLQTHDERPACCLRHMLCAALPPAVCKSTAFARHAAAQHAIPASNRTNLIFLRGFLICLASPSASAIPLRPMAPGAPADSPAPYSSLMRLSTCTHTAAQ